METVVVIVVILAIVGWVYAVGHKAGKREGSRKGYGVGFDRGRRTRSKSGCLIIVAGLALAAGSLAIACFR